MKEKTNIFKELDSGVQHFVDRFGLEKATQMINSLTYGHVILKERNKLELIIRFLTEKASETFGVSLADLYLSKQEEARDARMCCYYLLIHYLKMSYAKVGRYFKQTKRGIRYNYKKIEEILSIKSYYKDFYARFEIIEALFIHYILQLNLKK